MKPPFLPLYYVPLYYGLPNVLQLTLLFCSNIHAHYSTRAAQRETIIFEHSSNLYITIRNNPMRLMGF